MGAGTEGQESWDLFLAHAGSDLEYAELLYKHLEANEDGQHRPRVFLDSQVLKLGDDWDTELAAAQKNARVTVVLVSENSERAYYQREEIAAAVAMAREDKTKHRVVPVLIGNVQDLHYGLRLKHGLRVSQISDLQEVARRLRRLIQDLNNDTDLGLATRAVPEYERADNFLLIKHAAKRTQTMRGLAILGWIMLGFALVAFLDPFRTFEFRDYFVPLVLGALILIGLRVAGNRR